jgi:tripartite-type tricarboxylate transporter receptor subunit TctC
MNKWQIIVAASVGVALYPALSCGQSGRPIRLVVVAVPGGTSDFVARLIAPRLSEALRQNVIVDNKPSANGIVAAEIVAKATPDGLTLGVGNSGSHAINAALYRKLPYDPLRDFAPISQLVTSPMVIVVNPRLTMSSITDLIAAARKEPGKFNVAVAGASGQLAGEALKAQMKITLNNIPYKGGSPAMFSVISGESDVTFLTLANALGQIAGGKLKALAVTSAKRTPLLPTVPAVAESGIDDYDFNIWHGMFAPPKMPAQLVHALNKEVVRIINLQDFKERVAREGCEIVASTPEQFAAVIKTEVARYKKIVAQAGIPLE